MSKGPAAARAQPEARPILEVEAVHEPFIRKRQRAATLQDASDGHVLPRFREVLDCASPLALWLPLQKWVHGSDARPMLEVEALHEPEIVLLEINELMNPSVGGNDE